MAKKTIKYLENGEYHDATVKDVGVIEELKTESKDNLVEAINEIFLGGGKGFSDLQQKVDESTQAAQNAQQAANNLQQKLDEVAQNVGLSDEEARKIINQAVEDAKRAQAEALQAYKEAQKELDDSMAQFMEEQKAINKELEQAKADIQGDIDQKNAEIEQINTVIESTKSDLTATSARLASVRNDLSNAQMDWGKVRTEITNINGKLDSKMSNTDFDEYKERIERNETEVTQTKNELQSKATKQDLDVLTGTVTTQGSNITQLAGKIEQKVSKDTLANDIDDFQVKKANIFTGTREFMGWEFSDKALGRVNDDIYNHAKVAELHNGSNLSITVNGLEVGKTYSVSIFAKASANSNTSGIKVTVDNGKSYSGLMRTVYTPHDTKVTTNWQRYYATIVASATTMKFVFDRSGMTSDITLYLNRPKLEVGETVYTWEDNAQDIYKRVEHTEAQFDVYNDQISGIVQRQTETDKKIENVSSTFSQRADGIEANSKKYTNDKVTGLTEEFSGKLKATSDQLSAEYEKQTNAKIGALSDGGSNLILNSSFLVTDNNGNATLENWRDTSSKVSLTTISDKGSVKGLDGTWLKSGKATSGNGTGLGARTNYFPVKQGKLVVGVDVVLDAMGRPYNGSISPYILRIEYYDASNNRVNYEDVTLQKLGLTEKDVVRVGLFENYKYARGVYKTSNDRSDVAKACIVVPETITGYDMYLTNFFAKFSDVNDGTYEVNPLDQQASLIKQRTKIEQDSEKINLLNTQTEKLGNDIKATNTSVNVLKGEVDLKASQSTVNNLTNRVAKNEADIKVFPDKIRSEVSEVSKKVDGVNDKVDGIQVGGTNLLTKTSNDWKTWTGTGWANDTVDAGSIDLEPGTYTFRAEIDNTGNTQRGVHVEFYVNSEKKFLDQITTSYTQTFVNAGSKGYVTTTFTIDRPLTDVGIHPHTAVNSPIPSTVTVKWRREKLEKGNVATDWSPAPEDTNSSIESAKSIATQTKDGFDRLTEKTGYNASTGEFSKITTQINEGIKGVSTQVSSVSNRLDNLSVGGTNLLKGTSRDLQQKSTTNDWVRLPYNTDFFRSIYPLDNFTARVWIEKPNKDSWLQAYVGGNGLFKGNVIKAGQSGYSEVHGTLNKDITGANLVIGAGDGVSVSLGWKELKLEKGNIATDWSPAPEDLQAGIDIATTKATQTNTKFERMISQIQYNDSTGEIGKYEHKITELANGTQEKISAIRTDSDKKLQSATQTLTNKIGDLERTVRTNTTNLGQYRQEMTNSAQELSLKLTNYQNLVLNDVSGVSNRLDNLSVGGTNLAKNTSNKLSNAKVNAWLFVGSEDSNYFNNLTLYQGEYMTVRVWIEKPSKDAWVQIWTDKKTIGGNVIKAGQSGYSTASGIIPTGFSAWNIPIGNAQGEVSFGWKEFKVEKGNVATDWSPAPEDTDNKIGILQGQITANANKFNTVYTKTDVDNKINPLNSRTEFLQDNSKFLLRVQESGAATGGVNNLLTNSDTFDGYSENNTNNVDFQKIEDSGLPSVPNQPSITMMGHVWDNYGSVYNKNDGIYLENGETYWFGVYLMTDSNNGAFRNLAIYASWDKGQAIGSANKYFAGEKIDFNKHFGGKTKTWKWNTFKLTGDGTTRYNWRIEPYNHIGGSIWTAGYMLVKSPFPPTGWSPNMTDVQMRLDSGGVTINGNTTIDGTLNAKGMILDDKTGSKLEFTPNGLDISYSQNRNQYFTFSGKGLDFWKYTEAEGVQDYPYHHKPGYARLGNLTAWDGSYNDRTNYTARKNLDNPTNYNGMGFVIDVTGGGDEFSIWQEGTSYRSDSGPIGQGQYWSLFNVNATGFGAARGRGIHHYTSNYFWSDQQRYNWQDDATLLGTIHDNGWKELELLSYRSIMAVKSDPRNSNVWVNGFIFGSPDGGDRLFGYDGNQWIDVVNKRTTRDNNDYTNHFASMHAWEFQAHAFTQTSQLSQKTDIEPLDTKDFMSKLLSIDLYKYRYKTQSSEEKDNYGAIIDDVNEVKKYNLPQEFITTRDKGVNTNNLITGLIATVQEQAKQIENLTFRILEIERRSING